MSLDKAMAKALRFGYPEAPRQGCSTPASQAAAHSAGLLPTYAAARVCNASMACLAACAPPTSHHRTITTSGRCGKLQAGMCSCSTCVHTLQNAGWSTDWIARPAAPWLWPAPRPQPPGCRRHSAGVQPQQGAAAAAAKSASLTTLSTVEGVERRRAKPSQLHNHRCSASTGRSWSVAVARLFSLLASLRSLSRCR